MLFNSLEFLLFLPIVFLLYWFVFRSVKWQNMFVVAASYVFYGWWNKTFLLLIAFTTLCSYLSGLGIGKYLANNKGEAKALCIANVVVNLSILGVYKYYNFFVESFVSAFSVIGFTLHPSTLSLILPVGISFYTFQALSYSIDVYKEKIAPTKDLVAFFAFISFFPQLVAGPIERATNLLPQFLQKRAFNYNYAVEGCRQMLWGFFKKVVIADNCARYADIAFNDIDGCGSHSLVMGAIFFAFQIYGDFSGYSSIAIGCAKLFGISLRPNFKVPYFSRDIAEFWRRWHISLNKWFVDYVYIPLGGSRGSKLSVVRNTFAIFLLSGLWHGANWTYVCWGLFHAFLFMPLLLLGSTKKYTGDFSDKAIPTIRELFCMFYTFILTTIGWIVFRSHTIEETFAYYKGIVCVRANDSSFVSVKESFWLIVVIGFMILIEWINRNSDFEFQKQPKNALIRNGFYMILIAAIYMSYMLSIEDDKTFIYFQF